MSLTTAPVKSEQPSNQVEEMLFEASNDILMSLNRSEEDWESLSRDQMIRVCHEKALEDPILISRFCKKGWVGADYDWLIRMGLIWLDRYLSRETLSVLLANSAAETMAAASDTVIFIIANADTPALSESFNLKATLLITAIRQVAKNVYPSNPQMGYDQMLRAMKLSPQLMAVSYSRLYNGGMSTAAPVLH